MRAILFLLLLNLLVSPGCRQDCICTAVGCSQSVPFFIFTANYEGDELRHFSAEELSAFFLIRTNGDFIPLDSVTMKFTESRGTTSFRMYYRFQFYKFPDVIDMRNYNLLIKNRILSTVDTISDIAYSEEIVSKVCNTCSGPCQDQYIEDKQYSDFILNHSGKIIEDYNIALVKRE